MKYAVEQRLRFFDFLLSRYGNCSANILIDYFGISHSTAMRDIKEYKKLKPESFSYNKHERLYYKTQRFIRHWK